MDDWVILAPTRWALRRAVVIVNQTLRELSVEQHPDKTFIGRIERGFTFLGYWITEKGVTGVAPATWEAFQQRVARLYEQSSPLEEIVIVNQTLRELSVEQHPDKTFIWRIERGFSFLGYWITEKGVTGVAPATWEAFQQRVARLYEQSAPLEEIRRGVEQYVRRWKRWVLSGVAEVVRSFVWPGLPSVRYPFPGHQSYRQQHG